MLGSDLCKFSDAYLVDKGIITVTGTSNRSIKNRPLAYKNNTPFISHILKINNAIIDNAEDLDVVIPMYNLIEYIKTSRKTRGSWLNYYRDEYSDGVNNNNNPDKNVTKSKAFKYETIITGSTYTM